jgi:hypothetical protein
MLVSTPSAVVSVTDRIVLTMPSDVRLRSVATLVLGGVGSRLDLPFERADDLQLAALSALEATDRGDVTLELEARDDGLTLAVGPLRAGTGEDPALLRVLSRLVDDVEPHSRDGAEWLTLRMSKAATSPATT